MCVCNCTRSIFGETSKGTAHQSLMACTPRSQHESICIHIYIYIIYICVQVVDIRGPSGCRNRDTTRRSHGQRPTQLIAWGIFRLLEMPVSAGARGNNHQQTTEQLIGSKSLSTPKASIPVDWKGPLMGAMVLRLSGAPRLQGSTELPLEGK